MRYIFLAGLAIYGSSMCASADKFDDIFHDSAYTRDVEQGEPTPSESFFRFTKANNIKREEVIGRLLQYANNDAQTNKSSRETGFALHLLRDMRAKEAIPIFVKNYNDAVKSLNRSAAKTWACGLMIIGGTQVLEIAKEIISDEKRFDYSDRFAVFENLAMHLHNTNSLPEDVEFKEGIRKLFHENLEKERDVAVRHIDNALAVDSEKYRDSEERERILEKFKDSSRKEYFQSELSKFKERKETKDKSDSVKSSTNDVVITSSNKVEEVKSEPKKDGN